MGTGLDTVVDGTVEEVELEIKFEKLVITAERIVLERLRIQTSSSFDKL